MKFVLCLALLAGLVPWLTAQDAASTPEIVVTATKQPTDDRVITVPVTVIDPTDSDATDLGGLLSNAPGVNVQTDTPGQPVLAAEGFGDNGFAYVNFLLDGVSLNRPDMSGTSLGVIPLLAVDHVEVLNGPASALYGDQSLAGAVNVVTKQPTKPTFSLLGSADQYGGYEVSMFAGLPISSGGGFLLAVDRDDVVPTRGGSQSTNWNLWSKLTLAPWSQQKISLTDSYSYSRAQLPGSLTASEAAQNPNLVESSHIKDYSTTSLSRVAGQWDYATDGFSLTVPVSAQNRDINFYYLSYSYSGEYQLTQVEGEPVVRRVFSKVLGGDLTTALAVGGTYQQLDVSWYGSDATETSLTVASTIKRFDGHAWGSVQQDWGSWVATGVVRYESSTTVASSPHQTVANNQQTFPSLTYTVGGAWIPDEVSKVAATVGSVFRYPLADEMVSYYSAPVTVNPSLQPESGATAEVSASTAWTVFKLAARGSVTALTNEIGLDTGTNSNINLDPTIRWIGDVDVSTNPLTLVVVPGTSTAGAEYTLTRALFTSGTFQGDQLPVVPNHKLRLSLSYQPVSFVKVSGHETLTSGFYMDGDFANAYAQVSGRNVIDADVGFQIPGLSEWSFTVYGHNLTNDQTSDYVSEYGGTGYYYPSNGTTFGASVKAVY